MVRSGIGKIRLIDYDQVSLSSLNRHCCATREDVGTSKVEVLKQYFNKVMPNTKVEVVRDVFKQENAEELLSGNPDFVVDCIDNKITKAYLIKYCQDKKLKIISSMGAGGKVNKNKRRKKRSFQSLVSRLMLQRFKLED